MNGILGGGVLALSFGCRLDGWAMGPLMTILVAMLSERSALMLYYAVDKTQSRLYAEAARKLFNPAFGAFVDVTVCLQNFGLLTGYIVLLNDLLPAVLASVTSSSLLTTGSVVVPCTTAAVLYPLSALPRLEFLRFGSLFAMLMVTVLVATVTALAAIAHHSPDSPVVPDNRVGIDPAFAFRTGEGQFLRLLRSMPLIFFAFVAHNTCLLLYGELRRRSRSERDSRWALKRRKMLFATRIALGGCTALYCCIGASGYLLFRSQTKEDILRNFTAAAYPWMVWVKAAMIGVVIFSFPIISFALRKSLHNLVFGTKHAHSTPHRVLLALAIAAAACAVGTAAGHNVSVVFGLTGSLTSTNVMYIFPTLFFLALRLRDGTPQEFRGDVPLAFVILLAGIFVLVGSTYGILDSAMHSTAS